MADIKVIPNVLIHRLLVGGVMTGSDPDGVSYSFDYDNEAGGPFSLGEPLTWSGGSGSLAFLDDQGSTGSMVVLLGSGTVPGDGDTITGGTSSATADVDGVVTTVDAADTEETVRRGRYRVYSGLTDCGLITIPEEVAYQGYRIRNVLVRVLGLTDISFYVVDRDGNDVSAGTVTLSSGDGYNEWRNGGVIVAPGCKFKAVGTGTATADGEIMFIIGEGWGSSVFDQAGSLGASNLPPSMART